MGAQEKDSIGNKPVDELSSHEIDRWFETARIIPPKGGEIVAQSIESFDYPVEPLSEQEIPAALDALAKVIKRYMDMTPEEEAAEEARLARARKAIDDGRRAVAAGNPDGLTAALKEYVHGGAGGQPAGS